MKILSMPQEVEVWYILPALRKELTFELKRKGLSQTKIAQLLNVTKPAITQYLNNVRAKNVDIKKLLPEIKISAQKILEGNDINKELNYLLIISKKNKITCNICEYNCNITNCEICFEK